LDGLAGVLGISPTRVAPPAIYGARNPSSPPKVVSIRHIADGPVGEGRARFPSPIYELSTCKVGTSGKRPNAISNCLPGKANLGKTHGFAGLVHQKWSIKRNIAAKRKADQESSAAEFIHDTTQRRSLICANEHTTCPAIVSSFARTHGSVSRNFFLVHQPRSTSTVLCKRGSANQEGGLR